MDDVITRLRSAQNADLALSVAGASLTIGAFLAFTRVENDWAAIPLLLLIGLPCAFLFLVSLAPAGDGGSALDGEPVTRWQTAFLIGGLLLLEITLVQLADIVVDPGPGTGFWTLAVTGIAAVAIARGADLPGATVLATLAFAGSLLFLLDKIDGDASASAYRNILLVIGVVYLFASRAIRPTRLEDSHVFAAAGALAIGIAAIIGVYGDTDPDDIVGSFLFSNPEGDNGWELVLLAVGVGASAYAAIEGYRGAGFVGILELFAFAILAIEGNLFGWPLILLLVAVAAMAYALQSSGPGGAQVRAGSPPEAGGGLAHGGERAGAGSTPG